MAGRFRLHPQPVVLACVALAAGVRWAVRAPVEAHVTPDPVPAQLGLWVGTPLGITDRAQEILETSEISLMEYRMGAERPVWFAQVAGFGNRAAFHPPEICYVGSHFEVLEREPISLIVNGHLRRLMRLTLGQGDQRFEAWYWFTANGRVTPSYYQQQAWLLADAIHRHPMSGTLVRISTSVDDPARTRRRLLAFVSSWDLAHTKEGSHDS